RVVRVSSQRITSTFFRVSIALKVISSRFPIGVPVINRFISHPPLSINARFAVLVSFLIAYSRFIASLFVLYFSFYVSFMGILFRVCVVPAPLLCVLFR